MAKARRMCATPLATDERGATLVEFGLIVPILCVMMMGGLDFGHSLYMQAVLQGAVQKASRDSSLENATTQATQDAIDLKVKNQLLLLNKSADVTFGRRFYRSYTKAAAKQAESFTDSNRNGTCDGPVGATPGESYSDDNNNGVWDKDGGDAGQGGARDVVVYTVTISYRRIFPADKLIGGSGTTSISASTILSNQPYGDQSVYAAPTVRACT
jgi:Flp pilus assembly pilin Flp